MSKLPTIDDATESVSKAAEGLIGWLDDPKECDHCGSYCTSETEYVAEQAMPVDVWTCPECGARYYRDRE